MDYWSMNHQYLIKKVYHGLMDDRATVNWTYGVWNKMNLSKHKFIMWLGVEGRLRTKDKLFLYNISSDYLCCLCGNVVETHDHIFFDYDFSKQLLSKLLEWIGVNF